MDIDHDGEMKNRAVNSCSPGLSPLEIMLTNEAGKKIYFLVGNRIVCIQ